MPGTGRSSGELASGSRRLPPEAATARSVRSREITRMKFADFICREAILAQLAAIDKEGAIREMVQALCKAGQVEADESESIVKAILKREELGSTGIGRGVAVPHTKHPSVDRLVGTVAVSRQGVDFASLDGETVHLFFLLDFAARPAGRSPAGLGEHLAPTARRHVLPIPQAGQDRRGHPATAWTKPTTTVRIVTQPCRRPDVNADRGRDRSGGRARPDRRRHRRRPCAACKSQVDVDQGSTQPVDGHRRAADPDPGGRTRARRVTLEAIGPDADAVLDALRTVVCRPVSATKHAEIRRKIASMQKLQGIAVSPGVAIGEALVMDNEGFRIPRRFVARDAVDDELERLDKAIAAAAARNRPQSRRRRRSELGEKYGAIFEAHLQMLHDPRLRSELEEMIRQRHYSPEYAVSRTLRRYAKVFQTLESRYLAERANDIFDIEKRLLRHLLGRRREEHRASHLAGARAGPQPHAQRNGQPRPPSSSAASSPRSAGPAATRRSWPRRWKFRPWSAPGRS